MLQYGLSVESARSDEFGDFAFNALPPGRYIVGVNFNGVPNRYNPYTRIVYPATGYPAHVIELALGESVDLGQWELPDPAADVPITGLVTWIDGTPAPGVFVHMSDVTGGERPLGVGGEISGPDGRFTIEGREGRTYTFTVRPNGPGAPLPIHALRIIARPGLPPVQLTIQREPRR